MYDCGCMYRRVACVIGCCALVRVDGVVIGFVCVYGVSVVW